MDHSFKTGLQAEHDGEQIKLTTWEWHVWRGKQINGLL